MIGFILEYLFDFWWLFLPFFLAIIVFEKRLATYQYLYASQNNKWVHLELKAPPNSKRTIQAMEEIFSTLHSIFLKKTDYQRYIKGYQPPYYVFLLVAHNGFLKFYIRCLGNLKDFVKTRIYAQYPEAEINEVEDPLSIFPPKLPNPLMNCFISEFETVKKEPYPIKTYRTWDRTIPEERIDPISFLSEGASQLKEDEWLIWQIFAMPVPGNDEDFGGKWVEKGQKEVNKLIGKKEVKEPGPLEEIGEFIINLLKAPFTNIEFKTSKKEETSEVSMSKLTPGEVEVVKRIQEKISKNGYWVGLRGTYIAFEPNFKEKMGRSLGLMFSFLRLFDTQNLNAFKPVGTKITSPKEKILAESLLATEKTEVRDFYLKRMLYLNFKSYSPTDNKFILNTEELATLFHLPTETVPKTTIETVPIKPKPAPPNIPYPEIL